MSGAIAYDDASSGSFSGANFTCKSEACLWRLHHFKATVGATAAEPESTDHVISAIENALAPLWGLGLWAAGRAADMLWLQFGERVRAPTTRNPQREVGEFSLHILCPWRIAGAAGVITGRSDIFVPSDPEEDEDDFRWDRPGRSIVDQQLKSWIDEHEEQPLRVLEIAVDRCAGFALRIENGYALEVFPDAFSTPHDIREHWRLLQPGREAPHFVVNNQGWG